MSIPEEPGDNLPRYVTPNEGASARDSVFDTFTNVEINEGTAKLSNCVRGKGTTITHHVIDNQTNLYLWKRRLRFSTNLLK